MYNRNEINLACIEHSFLFAIDRQEYKEMMPRPLPTIQEETPQDDDSEYDDQEVASDELFLTRDRNEEMLDDVSHILPMMEFRQSDISNNDVIDDDETEKFDTAVPDPPPSLQNIKVGRGTRIDEKGRVIWFSYRAQQEAGHEKDKSQKS
jgi:hypothetical protein